MTRPLIVGIGGTPRAGSSGERLARAVLKACEDRGAVTRLFSGTELEALPHFSPEVATRTPEQMSLVEAVRQADGLVIASPGYHGGMSGLVKNAIDLLEDLRADRRSYFQDRAVGLVVVAAGWQACGTTLSAMRDVVHAMRGWPTPIGIAVNTVEQRPFGPDGELADPALLALVDSQAEQILSLVRRPVPQSGATAA